MEMATLVVDNNNVIPAKIAPRKHSNRTRPDRPISTQYSSSEEEFHSDDNLRPYEEVKVAHHNKNLSALGLATKQPNGLPHQHHPTIPTNGRMDHSGRLYSYLSGSEGDIETDNPASPHQTNRRRLSDSSVSSCEETVNGHNGPLRDTQISQIVLTDSEGDRSPIRNRTDGMDSTKRKYYVLEHDPSMMQCPPPSFPPPPPPPIEDIPQRVMSSYPISPYSTQPCNNHSNYSDSYRHGEYSDIDPSLHMPRGDYSDPNMCIQRQYEDSENEYNTRDPRYRLHSSNGNVFISPQQNDLPRFPRTVPRPGTQNTWSPGEMPTLPLHSTMTSDSYPRLQQQLPEHIPLQQNGGVDRQMFSHPPCQPGTQVPLTAYAPGGPYDSTRYYSKFSSASHQVKKQLKQRCSWKCTTLILLLLCIGLVAVVAYFTVMKLFSGDERHVLANSGISGCVPNNSHSTFTNTWSKQGSTGLATLTPATVPLLQRLGIFHQETIPPKSFWRMQFTQDTAAFIKFNFSISRDSFLAVYARKNIPPTHLRSDFDEVIDGARIHTRSKRSAHKNPQRSASFRHYMEAGHWFLFIYNDQEQSDNVGFIGQIYNKMATDCPNDCYSHGTCDMGYCKCFPGFTGSECSMKACPVVCNGNGVYARGSCECYRGWKGRECELQENECHVPDCSNHGKCIQGQCLCMQGYRGDDCSEVDCPIPNCSTHGYCSLGKCRCFAGYTGVNCQLKLDLATVCAYNCSGHGTYDIVTEACVCTSQFKGDNCEQEMCRMECKHGYCSGRRCKCDKGWTGPTCEEVACDKRCDKHGLCNNGTCNCRKGWNGKHCTLDGCHNNCQNHGKCEKDSLIGWKCTCNVGWKGAACDVATELQCEDNLDNDGDLLVDCIDPDCCATDSCKKRSIHCHMAPDPQDILLQRQSPSTVASFFKRMSFLVEQHSVQSMASPNAFNVSQVSVIRGRLTVDDGSPLPGVRVSVVTQPLYGFTLTRHDGMFDILVNGGGSVTLEFMKQPFRRSTASVLVPWNQFITMDTVIINSHTTRIKPNPELCTTKHEHYWLRPIVLSTWQHTQLGACPDKTTVIPESQVLQESLALPGTDVHLVYHSSETTGYKSVILIQMTPDTIPDTLSLVHLRVSVEGVVLTKVFEADPELKYTFSWDRRNAYRMMVYGIVTARVYVGYQYYGCEYIFWETRSTTMSGFDLTSSEIGGWNLDIHHTYNFQEGILHKGDGTNIYLKEKPRKLINVLGNGRRRDSNCQNCNGNAHDNKLMSPVALASGLDGSLYVGDYNYIRKLHPSREEVASILMLSTQSVSYEYFMTVSPVDGRLYISDYMSYRILRVKTMGPVRDLQGNFEVVVGNGEQCTPGEKDKCGDGQRAVEARLMYPKGIAITKDGIIYVADGPNIRLITTEGIIHTLIGSQEQLKRWTPMPCDDIMSVEDISLKWPTSLAINPLDDTLHILDNNVVLKLTHDKKLVTIAGRPTYCPPKQVHFLPSGVLADDEQASSVADHVTLVTPKCMTFSPHGDLFIVESDGHHINRIRMVTTDGRIHHYAGAKSQCDCRKPRCKCYNDKDTIAAQALFSTPTSLSVTPDGVLHISDQGNLRVYSIMSQLPQIDMDWQYNVFSSETQEMYVFNNYGQHKHTINVITGQYIYNFTYNVKSFYGKLTKIRDAANNRILLERDVDSHVTEIVPPNGMTCRLSSDNMRRLHHFTSIDNLTSTFTYTSSGLMKTKTVSDGKSYFYDYDVTGRLLTVKQPTSEVIHLTRDVNTTGSVVHISSGSNDMVAMATYGSVQSVMHDLAETKVTYLPDGAVVVMFPSNLTVAMETGNHPIIQGEHLMHFKRKLVLPNVLVHRLEWRYYVRAKDTDKIGRRVRVGKHDGGAALHDPSHGPGRDDAYKGKTLWINGENLLTVEYDREHRTETIMDAQNRDLLTVFYDKSGLPTNFLPASDLRWAMNFTYNAFGSITRWRYGDLSEKMLYDQSGLLTQRESANGAVYRYIYRKKRFHPSDSILPSGKQYRFQYDYLGALISATMPTNAKHAFSSLQSVGYQRFMYYAPWARLPYIEDYDASGKLVKIIYPTEQRRVSYRYNSLSQPTTILFDRTEVTFQYHRDISKVSKSKIMYALYGCEQTFTYTGPLVQESHQRFLLDQQLIGVSYRYQYNNHFHLTSIHAVFANNMTSLTSFSYNRTKGYLDGVKTLHYTKKLPDRDSIKDSSIVILREYDQLGRLNIVQYKFSDKIQFVLETVYDSVNRITQWRRVVAGYTKLYTYKYDIDDDVMEVRLGSQTSWRYTYDRNGNVAKITTRGRTKKMSYDVGDRISKFGETIYKFDNDGFIIQRGLHFLDFNSLAQLTMVKDLQDYRVMFYYDALSRIVAYKDSVGNVLQYFYGHVEHKWRVTHTYNHTTRELTQYHYDENGRLMAMERKGTWYYIGVDPLNSPIAVFNNNGHLIKQIFYDPLGKILKDTQPNFELCFGYKGAVYNPHVNLLHIHERVYDPTIGRWLTPHFSDVLKDVHSAIMAPRRFNLYLPPPIMSPHMASMVLPIQDLTQWLKMLSFDFPSLSPDVSYMGEVRPPHQSDQSCQLMPMSSAFECTFHRDMHHILTLSNYPKSKITPESTPKFAKIHAVEPILGSDILFIEINGKIVVNTLNPTFTFSKIAYNLLNGSQSVGLSFTIKGRDSHHYVKSDIAQVDDIQLNALQNKNNAFNVTVNKIAKSIHGRREVDVKLHGVHSIINIRYGTDVITERRRLLQHAKKRAVKHAWMKEKYILENNLLSDYKWTKTERDEIQNLGYADNYIAEYSNLDVDTYPELADDCNYIHFYART